MFYFVKTPLWLRKLYKKRLWGLPADRKLIYLSFDDGPNPAVTPFVLDQLGKFNAKATFFCIGKNVAQYPKLYQRILDEGHAVGNHSFDHLDGWKTKKDVYLNNIIKAREYIDSHLFRPPYGRLTNTQWRSLSSQAFPFRIIMWTVLSGDFDEDISPEKCCSNVINNTRGGAIVVFHDSDKAKERMMYSLPKVLQHFSAQGFLFDKIDGE